MKNKRIFRTLLVLGLIITLLMIKNPGNNNITGSVIVNLVGGSNGIFALIFVILILVILIGGYDWVVPRNNN